MKLGFIIPKGDILMNGYMRVEQIAEIWGVSKRQVQILCKRGKIEGALKFGVSWAIPETVEKPTRTGESKPGPKPTNQDK